jgi:CubicO group peptidase (beta-lactamase class C family)
VSGLVRAVTGRTVGEFFADEVARPLDLDLHIGLPREMYDTVAPMIGPAQRQAIRSMLNRSSPTQRPRSDERYRA